MSPAEAMANGQPTLYFFQPAEICQVRYCRQAEQIAAELVERFQDRVNFMPVTGYATRGDHVPDGVPRLAFDKWDVWPVPPISDWLPEPTTTWFGLGLEVPEVVLVDGDGYGVYHGTETFQMAELEPYVQQLLGK